MLRYLGTLVLIGLVVYSVIGIVRSTPEERLNVPRPLWILAVLIIPLIGSVVWIAVSTTHRAGGAGTVGRRPTRGPSAPDDDDEFLWKLDEERRRSNPPKDEPTT
jgi:hypothetical protein